MNRSIAIVMAGGKGTRMQSPLPKVLVEVAGRPMIDYVLEALFQGGVGRTIVVVGYKADLVRQHLEAQSGPASKNVQFAEQRTQLGTGHAVMQCRELLAGLEGPVVVVAGDSPLMQSDSIAALLAAFERDRPACLIGTGYRDDPTGFGRVLRDVERNFKGIVEEKDATPQQRKITEVNLSCYVFNCRDLLEALDSLSNDNAQGEYYLTDVPGIMQASGKQVAALDVLRPCESLSINTVEQLREVERVLGQWDQGTGGPGDR